MSRRIILVELNEVPYRIVEGFCRRRPESALARTLPRCRLFRTHAEQSGDLSPWTTWPTLHRGVTADEHRIAEFGQGLAEVDAAFPPVYRILAERGVPTGVFGSLHSYPPPGDPIGYRFYVPDVYAAGSECFPAELAPAQEFTLEMVRRSARNADPGVPWRGALRLLRAAHGLGLRPRTLIDAGVQIASERRDPARRSRRRSLQAVLSFDVFLRQVEATRPAFATFFTNHVASALHRYWAAAFPEDYAEIGFDREWTATFRDEIDFAMRRFDRCFARLVAFAGRNPEYSIWVAGSMGQAATRALPLETQVFVTDVERFGAALGLARADWSRVHAMFPQYNLRVSPERTGAVRDRLLGLSIGGAPVKFRQPEPTLFCVDLGHPNLYRTPEPLARYNGTAVTLAELGLGHLEIEDKSGTTAYHVPQGLLLVYDAAVRPGGWEGAPEISIAEIAPAILREFGMAAPAHMRRPPGLLSD